MSAAARRALARALGTALALVLLLVFALPAIARVTGSSGELIVHTSAPALPPSNASAAERARGQVLLGLLPTVACPNAWTARGTNVCTHGPDSSPAGINVTKVRSTADLVAATIEGSAATSSSTASIPCYGDGVSGKRVQVVYAHASDVPDRFTDIADSIIHWTANSDRVFNDSAAETGGSRHVRWVTDASCHLVVQRVQLSSTGDDSYGNTVNELQSVGLNRTDRKYLVLVDANIYCGIASLYQDDSASLTNINNTGSGYARVDNACWGLANPIEAHEVMHLLGGVQNSAPHSTGAGHCTDRYDRMCYADSSTVTTTFTCPDYSHERLFDCNHDDYYSTNPQAGSYLATHWNTASSSYLESVAPDAWSPSTSTTASSSPTASATPTPTPTPTPSATPTTVTYSGSLSRKVSTKTYSLNVGAGSLSATVTFTKATKLTVTLSLSGSPLASKVGPSPEAVTARVSAGTYDVTVSGTGNASFTLSVSYSS
jgi:hypothetical protein